MIQSLGPDICSAATVSSDAKPSADAKCSAETKPSADRRCSAETKRSADRSCSAETTLGQELLGGRETLGGREMLVGRGNARGQEMLGGRSAGAKPSAETKRSADGRCSADAKRSAGGRCWSDAKRSRAGDARQALGRRETLGGNETLGGREMLGGRETLGGPLGAESNVYGQRSGEASVGVAEDPIELPAQRGAGEDLEWVSELADEVEGFAQPLVAEDPFEEARCLTAKKHSLVTVLFPAKQMGTCQYQPELWLPGRVHMSDKDKEVLVRLVVAHRTGYSFKKGGKAPFWNKVRASLNLEIGKSLKV